jgi:hypothetical protein
LLNLLSIPFAYYIKMICVSSRVVVASDDMHYLVFGVVQQGCVVAQRRELEK